MSLIRKMTSGDTETVKQILSAAFKKNREVYRPRKSATSISSDESITYHKLVCEFDNTVVGCIYLWMEESECCIGDFAVAPKFQGKGIGRVLMDSAREWASQSGAHALSCKTIRQTGTVPIYEKLGFNLINESTPTWAESTTNAPITEAYLRMIL